MRTSAEHRACPCLARRSGRRGPWAVALAVTATLPLGACARPPPQPVDRPLPAATPPLDLSATGRWATSTRSPQPVAAAIEPELARRCGAPDGGLAAAAQRLASEHAQGIGALDTARVAFELRVAGAPYPWPRAWALTGQALAPATVEPRLERWLMGFDDGGERRCGIGRAQDAAGATHLVIVAADVLADLAPLPVRARTGSWLRLDADLRVPATGAKVVLLGPRGRPRPVPTAFAEGHASAPFTLAEPGQWLVQLLADTERGPRPVAEALVFADVMPPAEYVALAVPGETASAATDAPEAALSAMIDAARASEGLPRVSVAPDLSAVALAHAKAMRDAGALGHDLGAGDVRTRLSDADVVVHLVGENVAHAGSLVGAHRALWHSPSHRETLLDPRYDAAGIGVVTDPDGSVWVCEVFAAR